MAVGQRLRISTPWSQGSTGFPGPSSLPPVTGWSGNCRPAGDRPATGRVAALRPTVSVGAANQLASAGHDRTSSGRAEGCALRN